MKLRIDRPHIERLAQAFPGLARLQEQLHFGLAVPAPLLDALTDIFPGASGRDIKGLTKLVAKYCRHKAVAPTAEVFRRCAVFRGMDLETAVEAEATAA